MAMMLVAVETNHPMDAHNLLVGSTDNSVLPEGVTQVLATAWTIELPKCSAFFAALIHNASRMNRKYVVAQLAEDIDPQNS